MTDELLRQVVARIETLAQKLEKTAVIESTTVGGGYAPANAQYVVMALNATLTDERVLAVGAGASLVLADGGAGGNATLTRGALTGDVTAPADSNTTTLTAAAVLAKLLTVDGAGSGLDADLLDGVSSAGFVPAASLTGGGVLATGGFTLTVPATGTAALLGTANTFTASQTITGDLTLDDANPVITLGTSANTTSSILRSINNPAGAGATLGRYISRWNVTDVAEIRIRSGTDTVNKDNGEIWFLTAPSGTLSLRMTIDESGHVFPSTAGTQNFGNATDYWGDVSYKTLTDRGCLGWFDLGVEGADGKLVSDTGALLAIRARADGRKTVYGVPMIDYKTLPSVVYKPAGRDGVPFLRDEQDRPYEIRFETDDAGNAIGEKTVYAEDGAETTALISIMIGAIRELATRTAALEKQ